MNFLSVISWKYQTLIGLLHSHIPRRGLQYKRELNWLSTHANVLIWNNLLTKRTTSPLTHTGRGRGEECERPHSLAVSEAFTWLAYSGLFAQKVRVSREDLAAAACSLQVCAVLYVLRARRGPHARPHAIGHRKRRGQRFTCLQLWIFLHS